MNNNIESKLVGDWRLISFHGETPDGEIIFPLGTRPWGRVVVEPGGFSVQMMDPDRPKWSSIDPCRAAEAELRTAFEGFIAYAGTGTVDVAEKTIAAHIQAALIPNRVGTDQSVHFEFDGDCLVLRTPPVMRDGIEMVCTLVWERVC